MSGIMDRLRALFGRERPADGGASEREEIEEETAIENVEADIVASRDEAFTRMTQVPSSLDDRRR